MLYTHAIRTDCRYILSTAAGIASTLDPNGVLFQVYSMYIACI